MALVFYARHNSRNKILLIALCQTRSALAAELGSQGAFERPDGPISVSELNADWRVRKALQGVARGP